MACGPVRRDWQASHAASDVPMAFGVIGQVQALPSQPASVETLDTAQVNVRTITRNQNFPPRFGMNGQSCDEYHVNIQARQGTLELSDLVGRSDADHPFLLHSYPFQVMSRNGQAELFRAWRDVVNVRSGEAVRVAIPFGDFGGTTVFHCHIAEHEDHGMMGVLQVLT